MKDKNPRISNIPCPKCNNLIPMSMQQILTAQSIFCPYCGLRIDINKNASQKAIEALKKINEEEKKYK